VTNDFHLALQDVKNRWAKTIPPFAYLEMVRPPSKEASNKMFRKNERGRGREETLVIRPEGGQLAGAWFVSRSTDVSGRLPSLRLIGPAPNKAVLAV
jgi:hypothetical protein